MSARAAAAAKPSRFTLAALVLTVAALADQLGAAAWLRDPQPTLIILWLALAHGVGLAISRFRRATALAISLVTGLGATALVTVRVLPALAILLRRPAIFSLWLMHVRLRTQLDLLGQEVRRVAGGLFPTEVLVTPLFAMVAWLSLAWLAWTVVRRNRAWAGILACLALLVLNDLLAARQPAWSIWFVLAALALLGLGAYRGRLAAWQQRRLDYPELVGQDWLAGAVAIAAVVTVATGWSTPQWRDSARELLDSLRPAAAEPYLAREAGSSATREPFVQSFVPQLEFIGTAYPSGEETVFYVVTDDSPAGVDGSGLLMPPARQHYWRGAIYDRYTGIGWEATPMGEAVSPEQESSVPSAGRYALTQQYEILALPDDRLFAVNQPVQGAGAVELRRASSDGFSLLPHGDSADYRITSWATNVSSSELRQASQAYPPAISQAYLQLPPQIPQRVRNLAARITLGAGSAYDKAVRIQDYLRATYEYRLEQNLPPAGRDAVDDFLFESRRGFCSHFASAMAIMLRMEGVPARVVTGFATGEWDGRLGRYRVPASAAHAWVEVYFPGYGWIEFEPTAVRSSFVYAPGEGEVGGAQVGGSRQPREARPFRAVLPALGAAAAVGLSAVAVLVVRRRWRWRRMGVSSRMCALYWRMREELSLGRPVEAASLTPAEHLAAQADWLGRLPRLRGIAQDIAGLYELAAYSAHPISAQAFARAQRAWRLAWRDRLRLRLLIAARSTPFNRREAAP